MVLFGELVIPSSRVLWDDEDEHEQFTESRTVEWQEQTTAPAEITNLLFIETKKLAPLARSCLPENLAPVCSLPFSAVTVYKLKGNNYLVICEEGKDVIPGEITELFAPWIEIANNIIAITSNCAAMFHKNSSEEMPDCFIRSLVTGEISETYAAKLEVPNLVTGISAGVLSYCQHIGKSASLYVCYSDSRPLDSRIARPVIQLLEKLNIPTVKPFNFKPVFEADSNLYM